MKSKHSLPEQLEPAFMEALQDYRESIKLDEDELAAIQADLRKIPKATPSQRWSVWWQWTGLLAASVAVMWVFVLQRPDLSPRPSPYQSTEMIHKRSDSKMIPKGLSIRFFAISRKTKYKRKVEVQEGEVLYEGDQILFSYTIPGQNRPYLLIASLNQRGEVAFFVSDHEKMSIYVSKSKGSFPVLELDDYMGPERIFVLTATTPFTTTAVKKSFKRAFKEAKGDLRRLGKIEGPWSVAWTRLILKHGVDHR